MLWLIVALLLLLSFYLYMKLAGLYTWAKDFHAEVVKQIERCCNPSDKSWPPDPPPDWP